jgi:hypothetical protein
MTLQADNGLGRPEHDIGRVFLILIFPVLDHVTGKASSLHRRMNMSSRGMIGMAFQAVRVLIERRRMPSGVTKA